MSMANYTDFAASVVSWLNREGMSSLVDQVEDLTAMGQRRIHRLCNLRAMEAADSEFDVNAQSVALPANFLRMKALYIVQGNRHHPVLGRPLQTVLKKGQNSRPVYYSTVGESVYFGPTPDQAYTALMVYYAPLDIVSTTTTSNWILLNIPELLLFATMVEASLFLKDDQRAQVWDGRFNAIKDELERSEERQDKEGGALAVNLH